MIIIKNQINLAQSKEELDNINIIFDNKRLEEELRLLDKQEKQHHAFLSYIQQSSTVSRTHRGRTRDNCRKYKTGIQDYFSWGNSG